MKRPWRVLCALWLLFHTQASAQRSILVNYESKSNYAVPKLFIGLGGSFPLGLATSGGLYAENGWGGTLSYNFLWQRSPNRPSDYDSGIYLGIDPNDRITDISSIISLRCLKTFETNAESVFLGFEAGPSWIKTRSAENFVPVPNPCGLLGCVSNYTYDRIEKSYGGLYLKGDFDIRFSRFFELEIALNSIFSGQKTFVWFSLMGKLGNL